MKKIIYKTAGFFSERIRRKQRTGNLLDLYFDHLSFDDIEPSQPDAFNKQDVLDRINKEIDSSKKC